MSETPYTPHAGSLPSQMAAFFARNPDETLTMGDITSKFDASRGNIHSLLRKAVEAGLLVREINDESEWIYSAGPASPQPGVRTVLRDTYTTPEHIEPKAKKPRVAKVPASYTNPDALEITDDAVPAGRASPGFKYAGILAKMKQGQCIKCTPAEVSRVSNAMRKHLTLANEVFAVRTIKDYGDGMARVWWLAGNDADQAQAKKAA